MRKDEKRMLIAEIIDDLSEGEKITFLTQFFNDCSNDFVAELAGFKTEIQYDNYRMSL